MSTATNQSVALSEPGGEHVGFRPYPARTVLDAQIVMARRGVSPGPIDGLMGGQTRAAIRAYQLQHALPLTGELDANTRRAMRVSEPLLTTVAVTTGDLSRLRKVPETWLGKSEEYSLDYETVLELMAEKGWAYQSFIRQLNPDINWNAVSPGTSVLVPDVKPPRLSERAALVRIYLSQRFLQAFDSSDRLVVHFPCSIGRRVDKRPVGELRVSVVVSDPDYTFNPEIFTESEEGRRLGRKLRIPPGPNNPVGVVWIGLDREGYGIHGTPDPENVGRTESHGCFRLANWNVETLAELAWPGMPVLVEP